MGNIQENIEKHPVIILIGFSAAVAGVAVVVVSWMLNSQHASEITMLEAKSVAEISSLEQRLISIERRIGDEEKYLDITNIPISKGGVSKLSSSHKSYVQGRLYVSPPESEYWKESKSNQLEVFSAQYGTKFVEGMQSEIKIQFENPGGRPGVLWKSSRIVKAKLLKGSFFERETDLSEIEISPYVHVLVINDDVLDQLFNSAQSLNGSAALLSIEDEQEISKAIDSAQHIKTSPKKISNSAISENQKNPKKRNRYCMNFSRICRETI